jgi:hypothetical protein
MVRVVLMDSAFPALYSIVYCKFGANFIVMHESAIHHVCLFIPISEIVNILDTLEKLRSECIITHTK